MSHFEDFKTYTKIDSGGYLTVEPHRVTATNVPRSAQTCLYKDFGVGHFGDFFHTVKATLNAGQAVAYDNPAICGVSNTYHHSKDMSNNSDGIYICLYVTATPSYAIVMRDQVSGNSSGLTPPISLNQPYWFKIIRKGNVYRAYIYTDPGCTSLFNIRQIIVATTRKFRYMNVAFNANTAGVPTSTHIVEDLNLHEKPANQFNLQTIKGNVLNKEGWMRT